MRTWEQRCLKQQNVRCILFNTRDIITTTIIINLFNVQKDVRSNYHIVEEDFVFWFSQIPNHILTGGRGNLRMCKKTRR